MWIYHLCPYLILHRTQIIRRLIRHPQCQPIQPHTIHIKSHVNTQKNKKTINKKILQSNELNTKIKLPQRLGC